MSFPSSPTKRYCVWPLGLLMLVLAGFVFWSKRERLEETTATPSKRTAPSVAAVPEQRLQSPVQAPFPDQGGSVSASNLDAILNCHCDLLRTSTDPGKNLAALQALAAALRGMDRAAVVAAIVRFLDGGRDATTGLTFAVQADGFLGSAPTLRVALLDTLGSLDRAAAAHYAEAIFQRSQVPDEWAIALRDKGKFLGRSAAKESPSYGGRILQLLTRQEWLQAPTAGFLHAFDAAVFAGGADAAATLVDVGSMRIGAGVDYAARLALDRMAMADFVTTGAVLASRLDAALPERADIVARADPHSQEQTAIVSRYLSSSAVSREEKLQFIDSFPNGNLKLSANLLTTTPPLPMAVLAQRDAVALHLLRQWRNDAQMSDLHAAIDARMAWLQKLAASRAP